MASFQSPITMRSPALLETSCGYLLQELQARAKNIFIFFAFHLNVKMALNVYILFNRCCIGVDDLG